MNWSELYTKATPPEETDVHRHVNSPLWEDLCGFVEQSYGVQPRLVHSSCGMLPGWNVKYKKNSKALCTLYPAEGHFQCLLVVGDMVADEAALYLPTFDPYVRALYESTPTFNGGRWMMLDITTPRILEDVKTLLTIRVKPSIRK